MAIISVNDRPAGSGYGKTQFRYAMTYVAITFVVLLILNIYCSITCQKLFYQSKRDSMIEKCLLVSDEIATLDVLNSTSVATIVGQMESLKISRLVVTDHTAKVIYDSANESVGSYTLLPEILTAIDGNDVCSWNYHDGATDTHAATPILYYGTVVGTVYMTEYETAQGAMIQSLQKTVLQITLLLEIIVTIFSIAFANTFSGRLKRIMTSMKIIQEGDYSHKVNMGGNDELTILGNEFNDLTERLQTSEQKRSRFVSDASHELKTPLASIKLLSDSILQYDMDIETVREFVGDIGDEADRLNRMTAKLLSLTKAEGIPAEESEIIFMAPTIRRVVRMLRPNALQAKITFQMNVEQDSPILILEDDLYQIVFNLIENGIKYNQPGGSLTVCLRREEDNAILTVTDTGMGIPEDAIDHVFERFYRVDKARSRATGGSGLGLAIVKTIVQRNRGDISVSSEIGKGTVFTVVFPAFDTEEEQE
ncbi:MAG: ATP-binding protein [Oscillospiraceae bacterium]